MTNQNTPYTLELRDITFHYPTREKPVFSKLNFQLTQEKIGLVGDNGTGKTTLLQIMVGLLKPDQGDILYAGKLITTDKDFFGLRQRVGMLFQNADDQLFCPTVLEDVAFGPLNLGKSQEEAREISSSTLKRIGLSGFEDRITHQLSGGEKRLVALATILAMEPSILLLDEPTNDLDHEARHRLLDILSGLDQAFLLISHDWDFLAQLCTGYYSLEQGRLLKSDTLKVHQHRHAHHLGEQGHHHDHSR
jgi:cobalt/nickel transport system ATP-binding protein